MINLALLRRQVISRLLGEFLKSSDHLSDELIDAWLAEAYLELQRQLRLVSKSAMIDAITGQSFYRLPNDQLDGMTRERGLIYLSDGGSLPLTQRTWAFMREHYGDFSNANAVYGPADWAVDESDRSRLVVMFPPRGGSFLMDYVVNPGELARVWDQDTITATLTNASDTVTLSGSCVGLVEAGDEFGIRSTTYGLPASWYTVESVDSETQLTLSRVYTGASLTGAMFTTAQVSLIEAARPGLVRLAPVEYALAKAKELDEGLEAAAVYLQKWQAEVERIRNQAGNRPLCLAAANAYSRHPGLRR